VRPRLTIIVGPFLSEPFAKGLRSLLAATGEFDVIGVDDLRVLADAEIGGPSILIMEGTDPAACHTYLDLPAIRSVVLFDPVGARAFVGVDNPTWRELADVVRSVAREVWANRSGAGNERVRFVDPRQLPPTDAVGAVGVRGADSATLAPLARWVELSLGLCLTRRFGNDRPGVPGWSVAPAEAFELLGLESPPVSGEDLTDQLAVADEALIASRHSLPPGVAALADVFALSDLELRVLCLVLAPEIDGRYATVIGVLQDDLTRRRPGLTLLAELMSLTDVGTWDLRRAVNASDSVVSKGLIRSTGPEALPVDVGLEPSPAVVAHLLASSLERAAADVGASLRSELPDGEPALSAEERDLARQLELSLVQGRAAIHLVGGDRSKWWFSRLAAAIGVPLVVGDLETVGGASAAAAVVDWTVLSRISRRGLLVLGLDALDGGERQRAADRLLEPANSWGLIATDAELSTDGPRLPGLVLRAPAVAAVQRAEWWSRAASAAGIDLDAGDTERLAATVTIDPQHIDQSVALAARQAAVGARGSTVELVQRAARDLVPTPLPPGARRIEPTYGWDDIVLPDQTRQLLHAITTHVLRAGRVLEEWGFASRVPYGHGVGALFSGPSGTGKTMAARVIARDLGVDLLQVDLSKTVSKYIGETEKNLERIFEAAESSGAVLLFDEADALFGKRTEIKDAHDRHANVEVAYLLQRMESFGGLAVLTTNLKQNIDSAFVRRLRFVVDFPLPSAAQRRLIWHKAFPQGAPLAADVDVSFLASRLAIPGGSIQSIALHAAFLAATDDGDISAAHLVTAARRELLKIGMLTAERGLDDLAG
jgi:hypothetical protein